MIRAINIQGLRGISTSQLDGFGALTVLVGPSGAGKSTVLDALLIAASASPGDAIGRVIKRRPELRRGAPWLFCKGGRTAKIKIAGDTFGERTCSLSIGHADAVLWQTLFAADQTPNTTALECLIDSKRFGTFKSNTLVTVGNEYRFDLRPIDTSAQYEPFRGELGARLIEPAAGANHAPLHRVYSEATTSGGLPGALAILRDTLDGIQDLRVLTFEDASGETPILHLDFGSYTVPVAGAGSGVYALVRLALELASTQNGVALVEEPEIHQHPRALHQTAKVMHAAASRGVQVILSTHSLDLIDSLVATADDEGLEQLRVIRVARDGDGRLRHSTFEGKQVAEARNEMGEDLR